MMIIRVKFRWISHKVCSFCVETLVTDLGFLDRVLDFWSSPQSAYDLGIRVKFREFTYLSTSQTKATLKLEML